MLLSLVSVSLHSFFSFFFSFFYNIEMYRRHHLQYTDFSHMSCLHVDLMWLWFWMQTRTQNGTEILPLCQMWLQMEGSLNKHEVMTKRWKTFGGNPDIINWAMVETYARHSAPSIAENLEMIWRSLSLFETPLCA